MDQRETEDAALASRASKGDEAAYGALMRRWKEPLYRFIRLYVGDADESYDLLQEAFTAAWANLSRYDSTRPFSAWLRRIALNKCRDYARRRSVRAFFYRAKSLDDPSIQIGAAATIEDETPLDRLTLLDQAIAALPDGLKAPLILCALEGRSHAEAAQILGLTPKAVELRIARAKSKLAMLYQA